jgi:hypothetical protein
MNRDTKGGRVPDGTGLSQAEPEAGLGPSGFDPSRGEGPWSLDYIEDAATVRRSIYRPNGTLFTDKASNYDPPENGIHLCGVTDDEEQPTTAAVYPMPPALARRLFDVAYDVARCEREEGDFVVDLCLADSIEEDFWSNRQLWPRAIEAWNLRDSDRNPEGEKPQALSAKHESAGRQASPITHPPETGEVDG